MVGRAGTGKIAKLTLEIKPTVSLESAVACVYMLNMFLEDNNEYRLVRSESKDGTCVEWTLARIGEGEC